MSNFAAFWLCLTPVILITGAAAMVDPAKQDYALSAGAAAITVVPMWWAIYFAIRAIIG